MAAKVENSEDNKMLAVYVTEWAGPGTVPDKISFGQVPALPEPKKNQVVIDIKAASINIADVQLLQDTAAGGWLYHTRKPSDKDPLVGGMDYAGVVAKVGSECQRLKVGDRVCGLTKPAEYQPGTWAEQTVLPEKEVCLINDDNISFVDATGVAMGAFVNFDMIKQAKKKLTPGGCRCLVIGASGALGTVMLQMLRKYECHTTAVCSTDNVEMVKKMGADEVVDYTQQSFGEQLAGKEKFGVVFDFVGGKDTHAQSVKLLEKGGMFVTAVGDQKNLGDRQLSCGEFCGSCCYICKLTSCGCCLPYKYVFSGAYPPLTEEIWKESVIESRARANIAEEVPFSEAPVRLAMKRVYSHHAGGRVVINLEKRE